MAQSAVNRQRAALAQTALDAFAAAAGTTTIDRETNISDLISNLFHLCERHDISSGRALIRANQHYETERLETDEPSRDQLFAAIEEIASLEAQPGNPTDKLRAIKTRVAALIASKQ